MSDVELLREAAAKMRERAQDATPGPWRANDDGLVWADRAGDPVSGSTEIEDARHIASWDPAVALAVADLLDATADEDGSGFALDCCGEGDACFACATAKSAVAVARAYLNRGQS